ncbi:MAG TPA: hypothetical protein VF545_04520 [Thermoleophilaceae bacterium]|jgi:hypothetical protein
MSPEAGEPAGKPDGHWSRDLTFAVKSTVRLKPTPPGPIDPKNLAPLERLFGTRFEFTPELLEELHTLALGVDEWLRQDPSHTRVLLEDVNDGIERAVAAGSAKPMSADLREAIEKAEREAKPRAPRATGVHETTLVPFEEEGDDGAP